MKDQIGEVGKTFQLQVAETAIAMKGRGDDIAEARDQRDGIDVVVRRGTAEVTVREDEHGKARPRVGP